MKKILMLMLAFSLSYGLTIKAEDGDYGRIAIFPIVPEYEDIPASARQQLQNKLMNMNFSIKQSREEHTFLVV